MFIAMPYDFCFVRPFVLDDFCFVRASPLAQMVGHHDEGHGVGTGLP